MIAYGDETFTLVEIDQPLCTLDYGNSPCTAQLGVTGTKKCYNSRFTCQDPANYDPLDTTLKFSFSQEDSQVYGYVIPSLVSISTSPLRVNIGGMDPDMSPFGERETVTLTFNDHRHSDLVVDKYRTERPSAHGQSGIEGFDPYLQGTFWGKWLARNPYHEGYPLRIKEGKMGDGESALRVRHYIIDKIDGPSNGKVTIKAKDLFSLIEERKAQAPVANTGELDANITAGATSLTLSPTGVGDLEYANSGHIAIGSEIMSYTRNTGSDVMTITRAQLNTEAAAHEQEDQVQEVLVYSAQRADAIITDLLVNFTQVTSAHIPASEWSVEAANNLPTLYTAFIPKPTPVVDLIGELAEQVGFTLWPDVETDLINLKAVGVNIIPVQTADDDGWVMADSMAIERDPDQRVSRVQVFYGQINPMEDLDDEKNYRSQVEARDVNAEDASQYGTKSIRQVFSRWIPQFGRATANTIADLILNLFRDPPFRATFELDIQRAGQLAIADPFTLKTRALVNDLGAEASNTLLPMAIRRMETSLEIEAQKLNLFQAIGQERIINIDDDVNNVNMRELHDSLYSPASDGEEVTFIIASGVIVGSDSTDDFAMRTGAWPDGVILNLQIETGAYICGAGGDGGTSGPGGVTPGLDGGDALLVEFLLNLTNNGTLGSGAGGGGAAKTFDGSIFAFGGGGAGQIVGIGPGPATNGTTETGGVGAPKNSFTMPGDGGDLGQDGEDGDVAGPPNPSLESPGGAAGVAIDGDSLVTHLSGSGQILGSQIN